MRFVFEITKNLGKRMLARAHGVAVENGQQEKQPQNRVGKTLTSTFTSSALQSCNGNVNKIQRGCHTLIELVRAPRRVHIGVCPSGFGPISEFLAPCAQRGLKTSKNGGAHQQIQPEAV